MGQYKMILQKAKQYYYIKNKILQNDIIIGT